MYATERRKEQEVVEVADGRVSRGMVMQLPGCLPQQELSSALPFPGQAGLLQVNAPCPAI